MTCLQIHPVRTPDELRIALAIRVAVFVQEQGGPPEDEPDDADAAARHYLVLDGERPVVTARLYEPEPGLAKIGRVALLPEYRGRGWGAELMRFLLEEARAAGFGSVALHAQTYAQRFYERLGFVPEGAE